MYVGSWAQQHGTIMGWRGDICEWWVQLDDRETYPQWHAFSSVVIGPPRQPDVGDIVEVLLGIRKGAVGVIESRIPGPSEKFSVLLRDDAQSSPYLPIELRVVEKKAPTCECEAEKTRWCTVHRRYSCDGCASLLKYIDAAKLEAQKRGRVAGEPLAEWIGRLPLDVERRPKTSEPIGPGTLPMVEAWDRARAVVARWENDHAYGRDSVDLTPKNRDELVRRMALALLPTPADGGTT